MSTIKLELDKASMAQFLNRVRAAPGVVRAGVNVGVWRAAQQVLTEAKTRVPVDTGALRSSGTVDPALPDRNNATPEARATFGGPSAPYALIQHERTDLRHEVGEAKYLENALNAYAPRFLGDVAKAVEEELAKVERR